MRKLSAARPLRNTALYVAFIRGINVGGNTLVPMSELKNLCTNLGFDTVQTVLASGNVIFSTTKTIETITKELERALSVFCKRPIDCMVRTKEELTDLFVHQPFKNIEITKATRCYVTFLKRNSLSTLLLPYSSPQKDFTILEVLDRTIVSVLTLSEKNRTVDAMGIIEKEWGKQVTTRNWNTIEKIIKKLV